MKVSAVLPVYNGEKYLRQALEGFFSQTYRNLEMIVVDDGSTDNSLAVLSDYADMLRLYTQKNSGVSSARNRGVRESQGELIAFLDQDDIWYSHKIQRQVEVFRAHPEVSFVYSDIDIIDPDGNITDRHGLHVLDIDWIRPFIKGHLHPYPSSVMMKRDLFLAHGGFHEGFTLNLHEDVELWARLCWATDFYFVEEPLVQYRWDQEERVKQLQKRDPHQILRNSTILYKTLKDLYGDNPEMRKHLRMFLRRFEGRVRGIVGKRCAVEGNFIEARQHFLIAWHQTRSRKSLGRYLRTFLPSRYHKVLFPK